MKVKTRFDFHFPQNVTEPGPNTGY